jgi:hypothetical protein
MASNTSVVVGEVLLNSLDRSTVKVTRIIGNDRLEVVSLVPGSTPRIVESQKIRQGIASGTVKRISQ